MHRRMLLVLALVVAMFAVAMTPATAGRRTAIRGHQDLDFNLGLLDRSGAAPNVSWIGEIVLGGDAYVAVYYPLAEPRPIGSATLYVEKLVVYDSANIAFTDGVLTTFEPGPMIFTAADRAIETANLDFFAGGRITDVDRTADSKGALAAVRVGDRTFWRGSMEDPMQTTFQGPFSIFRAWWRR